MSGSLYLVASPIGNLEDITYRAVRILQEADMIACEDTRRSRVLLERYGIHKPLLSYHEHNESERSAQLLSLLASGQNVALLSDAGTPLVSDPGYRLVGAAIAAGVPVHPIPGASAVLAALSASGFPAGEFVFAGFLPSRRGQRRRYLETLLEEHRTTVLFEAPHRVQEALADIAEILPERLLCAGREITKLHEEFLRGTAAEILRCLESRGSVKGEFTLVLGPAPLREVLDAEKALRQARAAMAQGVPRMQAIKDAARAHGIPKRELYRLLDEPGPDEEGPPG